MIVAIDEMSFGGLTLRGTVAPRRYLASGDAADYTAADPTEPALEIPVISARQEGLQWQVRDWQGTALVPEGRSTRAR